MGYMFIYCNISFLLFEAYIIFVFECPYSTVLNLCLFSVINK